MNTLIARTLLLLFPFVAALHAQDCWQERATESASAERWKHTAVWTGSEMIFWGGELDTGGRYNPATNSWAAVSTTGAPAARCCHDAIWTGSEMIVWSGSNGSYLNDGGRYNPATNRWTAVTTTGAPAARRNHTAVWTGLEMIVWGGATQSSVFNTGGRYNPATNSWTALSNADAPAERYEHRAVWTGSEMIVWGGTLDFGGRNSTNTGSRYNPAGNSWTAMTTAGAPAARWGHSAVWTGSEMIVWGGGDGSNFLNDTFSYIPDFDCESFRITSAVLDSGNLVLSFPSVTGRGYTLWRSDTLADASWTNTGLPAVAGTEGILNFAVPATIPGRRFFRARVTAAP